MPRLGSAEKLALIQPPRLVRGIVFDREGGAMRGFVSPEWVPEHCRLNTEGIQHGTMLMRDQAHLYRAGMEGARNGLADGAPRPQTKGAITSEKAWGTKRIAAEHEVTWGRYANWYKRDVNWSTPEAESRARAWALTQENDALDILNMSIKRQREWGLATSICGTDLQGANADFPTMDVTTMLPADFAGGGSLWNGEDFPWFEHLDDTLDYMEDLTGFDQFDMMVSRVTFRMMARSLQFAGIRMLADGTPAAGYGIAAVMGDPRLSNQALQARITGMERIRRVVVAGARAEFGPENGASDRRFMFPDMYHLCHFGQDGGEQTRPSIQETNDGPRLVTKGTGMLEVTATREGAFRYEHHKRLNAGWAAEERSGFVAAAENLGLTVFGK